VNAIAIKRRTDCAPSIARRRRDEYAFKT